VSLQLQQPANTAAPRLLATTPHYSRPQPWQFTMTWGPYPVNLIKRHSHKGKRGPSFAVSRPFHSSVTTFGLTLLPQATYANVH